MRGIMAAYVIAEVEVNNSEEYEEYRAGVPATVETYGGKYLVRGGTIENVEGEWVPSRLVVLQFDDLDRAKEWYYSEDYKDLKAIRHNAATSKVLFVEGL